MLRSMATRIAVASHGASRKWKLNAVCSSPGRTYLATCSGVCSQISPTKIRSPVVGVADLPPRPVHVVDLVLVPVRMPAGRRTSDGTSRRGPASPGPWPGRGRRRCGSRRRPDRTRTGGSTRTPPAPRRSSSRDRVGRHRTGAGTTGRAARRARSPWSMPTRRSCSSSRSGARHRRCHVHRGTGSERARRLPGADANAAWNQGCALDVWFGTMSTITRMPRAWASEISPSRSARVPKSGSTSR